MAMRTDDKARRTSMLEQAQELAARGHQPLMIIAVLRANGFPEAAEWIDQPHIHKELFLTAGSRGTDRMFVSRGVPRI
jgi:hypothetical protein